MTTAFVVTQELVAEINRAVAQARAHVIPWELMRDLAVASPTNTLMLSERAPGSERRPASIAVRFPGGVTAAISFEEQPAGILRHASFSTGRPGNNHLVNPVLAQVLCKLFGFREFPPSAGRVWVEEYQPGYFAVNVVELEAEREAGHA
jgi:hypothetical protein